MRPASRPRRLRRRRARVGVLLALVVVLPLVSAVGPATAEDPGRVPDAALDATIHREQLQLVVGARIAAVTAARAGSEAAGRRLAADLAAQTADQQRAADAVVVRQRAVVTAGDDERTLDAAYAAHRRAGRDVDDDRAKLRLVAVGLYTGGATISLTGTGPLRVTQTEQDADSVLTLLTGVVGRQLDADTAAVAATAARLRAAGATLAAARSALRTAGTDATDAAGVLAAAARTVGTDRQELATADVRLDAAVAAQSRAAAAFDGPEGTGSRPVPSILGQSALDAAQLVAWFDASGYVDGTRATVAQLARWYVEEGAAEDVRGDIAFAQAIVETGGFSSPDAVELNNYAGIGHCDSCGSGFRLPSPHAGVQAQIQLLRTWADPTLTDAQLASPPVLASLAPGSQFERGCCPTWNTLTGTWATDPEYADTVLGVYAEMLAYAVSQASQPPLLAG